MRRNHFLSSSSILGASVLIAVAGCRGPQPRYDAESVDLEVEASSLTPVVGDTVTFSAKTENVHGRSSKVRWDVPNAKTQTHDKGRVARVTFNEPGTYVVTATLTLEDGTEIQDSERVTVNTVP